MVAELLVDTRNPFIPKVDACVVAQDGQRSTWVPTWEDRPAAEVEKLLFPHRGIWFENANNLKLRFQPDGAAWISVGNLIDGASVERLRLELLENRQRVVKAPYLVWDVRGNPGGNSALGVQLAEAVWGADTVPEGRAGSGGKGAKSASWRRASSARRSLPRVNHRGVRGRNARRGDRPPDVSCYDPERPWSGLT